MASPFTRSSRRSEGLSTRSSGRSNFAVHDINNGRHHLQPNIGRKKRPRDSRDDLEEQSLITKKAKIAIEIHSRPRANPKSRPVTADIKPDAISEGAGQRPRATTPKQAAAAAATSTQTEPPPPAQKTTAHHDKVVNGIKHELDRLQPNTADLKDEKRKLRSQEGSRFRSDLDKYFPEYDEVVGNVEKEEHILNHDTPIIIADSAKISKQLPSPRKTNGRSHAYPLKDFPTTLFNTLHNAHRVDHSFLDKHYKEEGGQDPLSEEYFETLHKKPERQEKMGRNSDRGKAQHEKEQVRKLLEGLRGHDWLKTLGGSGITDSKKKDYEEAREYFIKGCEAIIEKFRTWREEEKRRKLEKDLAMAEAAAEDTDAEDGDLSDGDPPDYSDVDASAARQLQEEAIARSAPFPRNQDKKVKVEMVPVPPYELEKDFTSFFPRRHLREAALGKNRRSGRSVAAWGHPVPEVLDIEFDLPEEYRDEETLKAHARRKRRDRRISKS